MCILLILPPVASRRRKFVFLRELVSGVDVVDSRNDRDQLNLYALTMHCTMLHVRSMLAIILGWWLSVYGPFGIILLVMVCVAFWSALLSACNVQCYM